MAQEKESKNERIGADLVKPDKNESILNKGILGIIRKFPMKIAEDRIDDLFDKFDTNNN